jgi:hypothetical protein
MSSLHLRTFLFAFFRLHFIIRKMTKKIQPAATFAHILHNTGFATSQSLITLGRAWQNIYSASKCELVLFDHSPIALLASRKYDFKKVAFGSGFSIPTQISPMPNMRTWLHLNKMQIVDDEEAVLQSANVSLKTLGGSPLRSLHELYSQVNETLAITYPEIDLFPGRVTSHYVGFWLTSPNSNGRIEGNACPLSSPPKVFAYLKNFRARDRVLQSLAESGLPSVVYSPDNVSNQYNGSNLHIVNNPIDLRYVLDHRCVILGNGKFWNSCPGSFMGLSDAFLSAHAGSKATLGEGSSTRNGTVVRSRRLRRSYENAFPDPCA